MSDEIVHNLDGCEISLVGDDLDPEREYLLLDGALLQQRGLELVNTSAYLTITGTSSPWSQLSSYASVTACQASLGEALDVRDVLVYLVTLRCNHFLNSWLLEVPDHILGEVACPPAQSTGTWCQLSPRLVSLLLTYSLQFGVLRCQ